MRESGSPEIRAPRETDCGRIGSAELLRSRRRPCRHRSSGLAMIELPGVIESGMPRRNGQRKPGTTRGTPRRRRTAKASRISRYAVKSGCAGEWDGWGRLSGDGLPSKKHTGARAPGVERQRLLERRCSSARRSPAQNGESTRSAKGTKDDGKPTEALISLG